ncbi:flavodoxin family protein [Anaerosacchariphilus polymeriproducens]|uniref:NADPH-dependent oxidoreductase n=1 Tax=Anaerosacchariphilus polymeriproducens TaxID=1812858 RepID=A0A371AVM3_9FIRM|nr:NAD(P)H-dependent oxidoreductase [Anaerosacchariphilus polymeriproducens]RDU23617.1 NADPH-dependent oxidoreductase [Anaerosacchariphilus polymeriproducens]
MKIVVLHGQSHKGSTYNITKMLLDRLADSAEEILEFQTNHLKPCIGCFACIVKGEEFCPHRTEVQPIIKAIENADIIIAESPNYCMGMTGQLKMLFDHMAYRWMAHRPHPLMKKKIGVAISTTAGMGAKTVTKSIKRQMFWWSIPKVYQIAEQVEAMSWNEVKPIKKEKITDEVNKTADKILRRVGTIKPGLKVGFIFKLIRKQQKVNNWNPIDKKYWEENEWI